MATKLAPPNTSTQHESLHSLSLIWNWYKGVAKNNRLVLDLLDETLSRLLFWIPHSDTEANATTNGNKEHFGASLDAAWREIGYGILSLHRLSVDLALNDGNAIRQNHYGMSIRTKHAPTIAATTARICLTVIHSLMPSLVSLVVLRVKSKGTINNYNCNFAASKARLVLEQAKFVLRMSLLVNYWRQQAKTDTNDASILYPNTSFDFGILLDGGLYHPDQLQESIGIPYHHAMALQRRRNYVGERTGWRANGSGNTNSNSNTTSICEQSIQRLTNWSWDNTKTAIAEILYVARPLLWAWLESRYHALPTRPNTHIMMREWSNSRMQSFHNSTANQSKKQRSLWKGWLLCLLMDVLSMQLLERGNGKQPQNRSLQHRSTSPNTMDPFRKAELKRRKLRLLLHLLRSPIWSQQTLPVLEGVSKHLFAKLPLVGNVLDTVLWDWVLYYQHPFVAEEG